MPWAIQNPKGHILISTVSATRNSAKRKILDPVLQKYNALISNSFKAWEAVGYRCVRIKVSEVKK